VRTQPPTLAPVTGARPSRGRAIPRFWLWGGGSALGFFVLLGVAFAIAPSIIRKKVVERARNRGIEVSVGTVRLRWRRILLGDVSGQLEGVGSVQAHAREVSVAWTFGGLGDLVVDDLAVAAEGRPDELRASIAAWKDRHASPASTGGASSRAVRLHGAKFRWQIVGVELANGSAAQVDLDATRVVVSGGAGTLRLGSTELTVSGGRGEYTRATGLLGSISAEAVVLHLGASGEAALGDLALTQTPAVVDAKSPALWRHFEKVRHAIERVSSHFETEVELRAGAVTISGERGTLGPWGARVVLGKEASSFELEPSANQVAKPIVLRALVPRSRGKWSAEVKFGPATLAELGVKEGSFGLVAVDKATAELKGALEVDPDEQTLAGDGSVTLKGASFNDPRVADGTVEGIDLGAKGILASKGDLTGWTLSGGAFELGKLRIDLDGGIEHGGPVDKEGKTPTRLWATWSVPNVACSDALKSLPRGLAPKLDGLEMSGTFGAHGRFAIDSRALDKADVDFFLDQKCHVTKAPEALAVSHFREPFDLRVYDPKGNPRTSKFGPGTSTWTSYSHISPYVTDAVLTCEDGAFFVHPGFSAAAIRNALLMNLKAGKFAVGASTVTMQLAKNIFLDRRKQLSRKMQELVLTAWLEQSMTKYEILELYLNVIEFGPNIYGIGPASWHYFGRPPSELDPLEATFLISILPSPVKRHGMWDVGSVGEGYLEYLRTLLKEEHRRGKLDDSELEAALAGPLVFMRPGSPPPPSRIIAAKGVDKTSDDGFGPVWAPKD